MNQQLNKSFVAEIIGPAGSGKTTLSQLLRNGNNVRAGLSVWGLPLPLLIVSAFSSLPTLAAFCRQRKPLSWDDLKLVVQHNALLRLIRLEATKGYHALLVDEGAVFALAKLRAFGHGNAAIASDPWMQGLLNNLAPSLDAVIWLDAPDTVLARRIREREKDHRMKDKSDAEIQKHLSLYRGSFERVVSELKRRNGLKVFRFSTDELSMEQIAARVLLQARARA